MKKLICVLLAVLMMASLASCAAGTGDDEFKVGFIFLHDENSTYDKNFMDAAKEACDALNVEYVTKVKIPESNACYEAAA